MKKKGLHRLTVQTHEWHELLNITEKIQELVDTSQIASGLCVVTTPHTTAGLTLNSNRDPDTLSDLNFEVNRLVPTRVDFSHIRDTPMDASGHIKASLVGAGLVLIIESARLILGSSQGIFFWEFDGPRERSVDVKLIDC